jgi:lysophospholipase L1-like esterase
MNVNFRIKSCLFCLLACAASQIAFAKDPSSVKWESEIKAFETADTKNPPARDAVLFTGSSTIRLWKTLTKDFPDNKVINRGFGGCHVADCTYFADRIVIPYAPRLIVFRAGTNDIADGMTPEQVSSDFKAFVEKVRAKLPNVRIAYISINATPARWANVSRERKTNELIKDFIDHGKNLDYIDCTNISLGSDGKPRTDLFLADRLHFNAAGYKILASKVRPHLN